MIVVLAFRKPNGLAFILSVPEQSKLETINYYLLKGFDLVSDSSAPVQEVSRKRKGK